MKADICWDEPDAPHIAEIPLTKGALDRTSFRPKSLERLLTIVGRLGHGTLIRDGMPKNLTNSAHHCGSVTTSKAMDKDRISTLPDRQARGAVLVRRTAHHGMPARPNATKALDNGERVGGRLVAHRDLSQSAG
jgi:hypothetical protein